MPKIRMTDGDWSRNLWNRIRSLISGLDNRVTALEQGGGGGGGGGDVNVIEAISFNGVNVPPDSAKRVSLQEADPTVPAWAKAVNKPTYTAAEVGALPNNTPVPVTIGGTGANNAADARTNLDAQQDMGFYIDQQGYICQRIGSDA